MFDLFPLFAFINSSAENIHTFVHIMLIIASGYLDCFHLGAIINNAAVNIHVQIFRVSICFEFSHIYIYKWKSWVM